MSSTADRKDALICTFDETCNRCNILIRLCTFRELGAVHPEVSMTASELCAAVRERPPEDGNVLFDLYNARVCVRACVRARVRKYPLNEFILVFQVWDELSDTV